jgi:hypothetical protein
MVEDYTTRLETALRLAGKSWKELEDHLGISYQALKKLQDRKTKSLTAENSAQAARFCQVDHFWLATGQGTPKPEGVWPFALISPEQYSQLPPDVKQRIEDELLGAHMRQQIKNGTQHR